MTATRGKKLSTKERRYNHKIGKNAERIAAWWLRLHGWRILEQRCQTGSGEIDLLARRRRAILAVEVKFRSHLEHGVDLISKYQKQRIIEAARFLSMTRYRDHEWRFAFVVITPRQWPRCVFLDHEIG